LLFLPKVQQLGKNPSAEKCGPLGELAEESVTWTVHAPQSPMPQPNFDPVNPKTSRKYQSSGISGSPLKDCSTPFTLS
jgi:hypothetical protein